MVQSHGPVGGGGGAEVLEIGAVFLVELGAQPFLHALYIGHVFHDLHAYGRAQQLGLRLILAADLHHPVGLAALVGEQAEFRHEAGNGAHQLQYAGVAVAAGPQHGVGINHGGGLGPGEHIPFAGLVAHLVHIAGAAVGVVVHYAQLAQLLLIALLLGVHYLVENYILQEGAGHIFVQRPGVGGELLPGSEPGGDELVIHVVDRSHDLQAEADDRVAVFAGDRYHALSPKGLAVHHQGLDHLGHYLPLGPVQQRLLLGCKLHIITAFHSLKLLTV